MTTAYDNGPLSSASCPAYVTFFSSRRHCKNMPTSYRIVGRLANLAVQITLLIIISSSHYKFAGPSFSWRRGHQSFAPSRMRSNRSLHACTNFSLYGWYRVLKRSKSPCGGA